MSFSQNQDIQAAISAEDVYIYRQGYGRFHEDLGGAEQQAMHGGLGRLGRLFGKYAEEMLFQEDESALNPTHYIPTSLRTKLAQQRTALSQYFQQEATGTRMCRWDHPFHDFLEPYVRGGIARVPGEDVIPREV